MESRATDKVRNLDSAGTRNPVSIVRIIEFVKNRALRSDTSFPHDEASDYERRRTCVSNANVLSTASDVKCWRAACSAASSSFLRRVISVLRRMVLRTVATPSA